MPGTVIQGSFPHGLARIGAPQRGVSQPKRAVPALGASLQLPAHQLAHLESAGGRPLPHDVRQKMEAVFGARFDDVRIHVGSGASALGALAFTHGSNIHFAPGQYDPFTPRGQRILGHELAHVVQQRSGRARNAFGHGVAVVHDRQLEAEADRFAQRVTSATIQPALKAANNPAKKLTYVFKANHETYFQGSYAVLNELYKKIKVRVAQSCDAKEDDVKRILRKYLFSSPSTKSRLSEGVVQKDFTVTSWNALADLIVYEYKSESNYDQELKLAMIISQSPAVKQSVDTAIEAVVEIIGSCLRRIDQGPYPEDHAHEFKPLHETAYTGSKTYHPFLEGSPSMHMLVIKGDSQTRSVTESAALLHDLLERVWRLYSNLVQSELAAANPLQRPGVTITIGKRKIQPRSHTTEELTKAYTRKSGIPTEAGPSFTTIRFLSINNLIDDWVDTSVWSNRKPAKLTASQLQHLALAIFSYWTLSYRKSFSGAHTWFDVADAARACGVTFPDGVQYPDPKALAKRLGAPAWSTESQGILESRQKLLRQGLEQAVLSLSGAKASLVNPPTINEFD